MRTIVLDTNCLVVSVPKKSKYRKIWKAFLTGKYKLAVTTEILTEYAEVLSNFYSPSLANYVIETIINAPNVIETTIFYKWGLIDIDKDDNKFVDCAVSASADFLVTEDKHFNVLKKIDFPPVNVLSIKEFMKIT